MQTHTFVATNLSKGHTAAWSPMFNVRPFILHLILIYHIYHIYIHRMTKNYHSDSLTNNGPKNSCTYQTHWPTSHLINPILKGEVCREMLGWNLQDVEEMAVVEETWLGLAFILQNSHHYDFQITEGFRYPTITLGNICELFSIHH